MQASDWEQIQNNLIGDDENKKQSDFKQKSLKNNFMEPETEPEESEFVSKFKQFKDSNPTINHQAELSQRSNSRSKVDTKLERARANRAAKIISEQKAGKTGEDKRKQAQDRKARMDKIKSKYTNYSRSRSRKRSGSNGPKS